MPTDIFQNQIQHGGAWRLDGAVISLSKGNDDLIVNNCSIQYQRPVNKINPLNTDKQYLIAGRGNGVVQLGIIVGPSKGIKTFIESYSDPCKIRDNVLTIRAASIDQCATGAISLEFICEYCLLQGINASVTAGDMAIVSAGASLIVGSLSLK
jgi:hypothetical protein